MGPNCNLDRAGNTTSFAIGSGRTDVVKFFQGALGREVA